MSTQPSLGLGVLGTLCGQKFKGSICYLDDSFSLMGQLVLKNTETKDILPFINTDLSDFVDKYCSEIFGKINAVAIVYHDKGNNLISVAAENISFIAASKDNNALFLFSLLLEKNTEYDDGLVAKIMKLGEDVVSFFGIKKFLIMFRKGNSITLKDVSINTAFLDNIDILRNTGISEFPSTLNGYDLVLASKFIFEGNNSIFTKAMSELLGISSLDLFIGTTKDFNSPMGLLSVPEIDNNFLKVTDMYLQIIMGRGLEFEINGEFTFKFLPEIQFLVNCGMGIDHFLLSLEASVNQPIKLVGEFAIGDTELLIGYDYGLTFGMASNLYIRKLSLFAAIILKCYGEVINVQLLSAAISELSILSLVENFTGLTIPDLEMFEVIKIEGFDFTINNNFPMEILGNKEKMLNHFNNNVNEVSLKLSEASTKIVKFNNGTALIDQSRMRHYFVNGTGNLFLQPQFYYSVEPNTINFGSYVVSPGMFACGVILFFGVKLKIFFSINPQEGILAFLQISEFKIGPLKLTASSYSKASGNIIQLPDNSIIHQFVEPNQTGATLFLSANKDNLSFYLDGCLSLEGIFMIDTRILYFKKYISINARFQILNIFTCSFSLTTDYQSANSLNFEIVLSIDTTGLERLFQKVTKTLENAIEVYKSKMNNATRAINDAQAKVNNLQAEIDDLNRRIQNCKDAISRTSRWKRWLVAIAKGAEIAGYEVAKAGVNIAIGVATAALQAAKAAVNLTDKLGEGVLNAINGVINGIMQLFYIRKFELRAAANRDEQSFLASIEFVALGKEYTLNKTFSHSQLSQNPTDLLSDEMNNELSDDVNNINNNCFRSNKSKFTPEQIPLSVHKKRLQDGLEQIKSSRSFIEEVQQAYFNEFGETLEVTEDMNVQFAKSLDSITSNLEMVTRIIDIDEINKIITDVKSVTEDENNATRFRDDELKCAGEALENFNNVIDLHKDIQDAVDELVSSRKEFDVRNNEMNNLRKTTTPYVVEERKDKCNMLSVMDEVEDLMAKHFPSSRSNYYINFSKEKSMYKYLDEDREIYGGKVSEKHQEMRSRVNSNNYIQRL